MENFSFCFECFRGKRPLISILCYAIGPLKPGGVLQQSEILEDEILTAIRRIVRAVDLRSRALIRGHRISGPQLVTLREVSRMGPVPVSALARAVAWRSTCP